MHPINLDALISINRHSGYIVILFLPFIFDFYYLVKYLKLTKLIKVKSVIHPSDFQIVVLLFGKRGPLFSLIQRKFFILKF